MSIEEPTPIGPRGFAVTAGLDRGVAAALAARCAELGYGSLWSNDHGAADGLETLAALASGTRGDEGLAFGIAGLALDRREPGAIAEAVDRSGLDPARLLIAIGPGAAPDPPATLRAALPALRDALPAARVLAAGTRADALTVAGELYDGALVEWMPPALIARARDAVAAGARRAGRQPPPLIGYLRAAVGADAETRLARDEGFYRGAPVWREHFARLEDPGRTGVSCDLATEVPAALAPYQDALDALIVRGLAATRLPNLDRIATAAAPGAAGAPFSPEPLSRGAASAAR